MTDPHQPQQSVRKKLPAKIQLKDYPALKRLAWQLKGSVKIELKEALQIYEQNWRHIDMKKMSARETKFLEDLLEMFGRKRLFVSF